VIDTDVDSKNWNLITIVQLCQKPSKEYFLGKWQWLIITVDCTFKICILFDLILIFCHYTPNKEFLSRKKKMVCAVNFFTTQ
jgi:hypothetical protein